LSKTPDDYPELASQRGVRKRNRGGGKNSREPKNAKEKRGIPRTVNIAEEIMHIRKLRLSKSTRQVKKTKTGIEKLTTREHRKRTNQQRGARDGCELQLNVGHKLERGEIEILIIEKKVDEGKKKG